MTVNPPSHPSQHGLAPAFLRFEHWTPKGDCKVTGNKERTSILYRKSLQKKFTKKLKSPSNLHEKSFINWSDLEKKNTREFPLNLIWFYFTGKSFVFFSTFSMISKKSNLEGVFEFFYSDPQLDPNFKPTRNLSGQLLYIYLCIYVFSV